MDGPRILTYSLREELGHDRLGRVFRAWDIRTFRPVVLRLFRVAGLVSASREEDTRVELRRRLRDAGHVAHPNLAAFIELNSFLDLDVASWEDHGGAPIMERLTDGAPVIEALRWAIEAAGAIARAHARSIPHGRITIANVVVGRDDSVRVLDLGVPRPREIPFLVSDEANVEGVRQPLARDLKKLMRKDLDALAEVVLQIVTTGPEVAHDAALREGIVAAVREHIEAMVEDRRATVASLHAALVDVARRTPVENRSSTELRLRPVREETEAAEAAGGAGPPARYPLPYRTGLVPADLSDAGSLGVPFSLEDYRESTGQRTTGADAAGSPLRVWTGAAFEASEERDEAEWERTPPEPLDPLPMTHVFLPPIDPREEPEPRPEEPSRRFRFWPHGATLIGVLVLLVAGVYALRSVRSAGETVADAPAVAAAAPVRGLPPAVIGAPPRPVARRGQPSGTLVVSTSQEDVTVSIDNARPETAPVRWDEVPATRHVLRIEKAGYITRIDTVEVRAGLTTTRYYTLVPDRTVR